MFKIGDRVVLNTHIGAVTIGLLKRNKEYEVESVSSTTIYIQEENGAKDYYSYGYFDLSHSMMRDITIEDILS